MAADGIGRHTPELSGEILVRALSVDGALLPYFGDVINLLANEYQWVEVGDTVPDIVQACADGVASWYSPMNVGQISYFIGSAPDGWLVMDGSTYDAGDYPELMAIIDSQFKDVPSNEFTLPDMGGLFPLGANESYVLGDTGGSVSVTLVLDEIPSHNHTYVNPVANVDLEAPGAPDILAAGVGPGDDTGSAGGGSSHENMPPYVSLIAAVFSGRV